MVGLDIIIIYRPYKGTIIWHTYDAGSAKPTYLLSQTLVPQSKTNIWQMIMFAEHMNMVKEIWSKKCPANSWHVYLAL